MQLLRAMLASGEISATNLALQHRLDRLEMEGFAASTRIHGPDPHLFPAWNYRITDKGRRTVHSEQ